MRGNIEVYIMETAGKQNDIRIKHQMDIMNLLRKGKTTLTDIAECLDVSFTAAKKITDELVRNGLVVYSSKNKSSVRGRKPVFVEINNKIGVVGVVDFSSSDAHVLLASLDSTIVVEEIIPNVQYITRQVLVQVEELIRKLLLEPKVKNRPLLSICVISPGIMRADDYEYVCSRSVNPEDISKINPVSHLSNAFNVKVEMHNDVRIGCFGELKYGAFPKEKFNGMFIHLGISSGIALIFDGRIYRGSNNFSGETAAYNWKSDDKILKESIWNSKFFPLWEISELIRVSHGGKKEDVIQYVDVDKIIKDFENKDEITVRAIEESAKRNAITIIGLATILDVEYIVIEGQILRLGPSYMDLLRQYLSEFSETDLRSRLLSSTLKDQCEILGACYQATNIFLFDKVESITKQRTKSNKFVLDEYYKEI